jgi:hypothetical protein
MKTDFSKLPIGTKVWSFRYGWCEITKINTDKEYSIRVRYKYGDTEEYTSYGFCFDSDVNPTLFLRPFEIPVKAFEQQMPEFKKGMKLYQSMGKPILICDIGVNNLWGVDCNGELININDIKKEDICQVTQITPVQHILEEVEIWRRNG